MDSEILIALTDLNETVLGLGNILSLIVWFFGFVFSLFVAYRLTRFIVSLFRKYVRLGI